MQERTLYEYAVIRILPRVDREEFINVGVILYCPGFKFLRADCSVNENRLRAFAADLRVSEMKDHLKSVGQICSGGEGSGPIGRLSPGERFRWLTAPRSTVVQTSAVHTGLTVDPERTLHDLMEKLVR